jgi:hypothetical protein
MLGLNFAVINGRKEPFQPRVGSPGAHQTSVHPEWVPLTKLGKKSSRGLGLQLPANSRFQPAPSQLQPAPSQLLASSSSKPGQLQPAPSQFHASSSQLQLPASSSPPQASSCQRQASSSQL